MKRLMENWRRFSEEEEVSNQILVLYNPETEEQIPIPPDLLDQILASIKIANQDAMSDLNEKAKSKSQQRYMGMVHKCKEEGDCASTEVEKTASSMKSKDVEDFAKTKHKGLPNKVESK